MKKKQLRRLRTFDFVRIEGLRPITIKIPEAYSDIVNSEMLAVTNKFKHLPLFASQSNLVVIEPSPNEYIEMCGDVNAINELMIESEELHWKYYSEYWSTLAHLYLLKESR